MSDPLKLYLVFGQVGYVETFLEVSEKRQPAASPLLGQILLSTCSFTSPPPGGTTSKSDLLEKHPPEAGVLGDWRRKIVH